MRVRSISRAIIAAVMVALTVTAVTAVVQMLRAQREAEVALAGQTAATAELVRTQDDSQSDLAAALAFDSLQRNPSSQAEQTLRATLEVLPIQLASFETEAGVTDIAFPPDAPGLVTLSSKSRTARLHDLSGKLVREFACPKSDVCEFAIKSGSGRRGLSGVGGRLNAADPGSHDGQGTSNRRLGVHACNIGFGRVRPHDRRHPTLWQGLRLDSRISGATGLRRWPCGFILEAECQRETPRIAV